MTIEEMQSIISKATPGPWRWCYDGSSDWSVGPKDDPQGRQIASCWRSRAVGNPDDEYIATFNPHMVYKMLQVVKIAKILVKEGTSDPNLPIWNLACAVDDLESDP